MPEFLTLAHFTPLLGSAFKLPDTPGVEIVLSEANPLPSGSRPPADLAEGRESFDLIFVGPLSPVLPQRTYRMEAEGAPPLEIFIVPIGPLKGGLGYQAIFN